MLGKSKQGFPPGVAGEHGGNGKFPFNDPRALENLFSQQSFPNVLKEFVHPGKEPREMEMRTIFKDEREANAFVLYYAKCEEFNLTEEKEVALSWLASRVSIRGMGRRELLMAATNIIATSLYGIRQWGNKRGREREEQPGP